MYVPSFEELVGNEETFFKEFFNKLPLLRKKALKGDLSSILSTERLEDTLHLEAISPVYLRVTQDGKPVPASFYTERVAVQGDGVTEAVRPEKVYELYRAGATLTWDAVNHFQPQVRAIVRELTARFATRSAVSAFLTPAGRQGFKPHHDTVDVFVVQLEGTKHWKVWKPIPGRQPEKTGQYLMEELGEPFIEVTLEPGDVLYMPFATPHVAVAEDKVSLHLSVAVRPRTWSDLLLSTVEQVLKQEEFWTFPHLTEGTLESERSSFSKHLRILTEHLGSVDLHSELMRLIGQGRDQHGISAGTTLATSAKNDRLDTSSQLRRAVIDLTFHESTDGKVRADVNGRSVSIPDTIVSVLESIPKDGHVYAQSLVPGASSEQSMQVARTLVRIGVLELVS